MPRPTTSQAEREVWSALKKRLPSGWHAWHSLRLRNEKGYMGEGDFVLAHPERGLLVLEVKGGHVDLHDGRWHQNGLPLDPAPLTQALDYQSFLLKRLDAFGSEPPAWGVAAAFPDTEFDEQPGADDARGAVLGKTQLHWLEEYFDSIVKRALPAPHAARGDWIARLQKLWGESWVPSLSLGTKAQLAEEQRLALDAAQLAALEGLLGNDRVLISGGAGSGKTLLAAEAARRHAAEGKRVLLLCFTAPLQRWLAARLAADGVEVETVSGLAKKIAVGAGVGPEAGDLTGTEYWRATYERALDHAEPRWDVVVVDEGQDLTLEAWCLVDALAKGRRLWVLHDPSQGYWAERRPPTELFATTFTLPRGQRCPPGIEALAARYAGKPADDRAIARAVKEGSLSLLPCDDPARAAAVVGAEIDRLLAQGLRPEEIGVVSLRGQSADGAILRQPLLGKHAFVPADHPEMEDRLVADTFLRWKGLERPAIIVVVEGAEARERFTTRMHIALTRALVAARIVGPACAEGKWPGLAD
ncbi:MAG: NERD domain-containing protein [Anaeromyxobacteraceae bacterium]